MLFEVAPEFLTNFKNLVMYWRSELRDTPTIDGPRFVDAYLSDLLALLDDAITVERKKWRLCCFRG